MGERIKRRIEISPAATFASNAVLPARSRSGDNLFMTSQNEQMRSFHRRLWELNGGAWFDFEPHLTALYRAVLEPGSTALDGGANIGLHTIPMAHSVLPNGLVIAIEPVPELQDRLEVRRREQNIPDHLIRILPFGLSQEAGRSKFYQVIDPDRHGLSSLRQREFPTLPEGERVHLAREILIDLTTLDAVCEDLSRLDFVKLDIEGAEMDALRGGAQALRRFRPVIAIEQDQYSPQYFNYTWEDLLEYFASINYEIYDLFGFRYGEAAMFDLCAVWDFVGLPVEHPNKRGLFEAVRRSMELAGVRFDPVGDRSLSENACFLDRIGNISNPCGRDLVRVEAGIEIQFSGWAVDVGARSPAAGVDVVIDGAPFRSNYGIRRPDVSEFFKNQDYRDSGFSLTLPAGTLGAGQHVAFLRVWRRDKTKYHDGLNLPFTVFLTPEITKACSGGARIPGGPVS